MAHVKPPVIPILHNLRDDTDRNVSTPRVTYLEEQAPDRRSVTGQASVCCWPERLMQQSLLEHDEVGRGDRRVPG